MKRILLSVALLLATVVATRPLSAQPAAGAAGHWDGAIDTPNQKLTIAIDLAPKGDAWQGAISIPQQNLKGLPLTVSVKGDAVTLSLDAPGRPVFDGKLDASGTSIAGDFQQGGVTMKFSMSRTGDATFDAAVPSTAITKDLEGNWEGALVVNGQTLRLQLKLASGADGLGKGTLVSVDQNGAEIPIQTISQSKDHVELLLPLISGAFKGDLKDGRLSGTWSQGPVSEALVFTRAAK